MLYLVIERFKAGAAPEIYRRLLEIVPVRTSADAAAVMAARHP